MKKILKVVSILAVVSVMVFGSSLSVFAYGRGHNRMRYSTTTSQADYDSYREERTKEYEKFIDDKVAAGELTKEEADTLKTDFNTMRDYCNSFHNNPVNSGYSGHGGCHGGR